MLFGLFPHPGRCCPQRRVAEFSDLVRAKAGRARGLDRDVSGSLFHYRKSWGGVLRGSKLAVPAVAGDSHPYSRIAPAEGEAVCDPRLRLRPVCFPRSTRSRREIENEGFAHINDAGWDWEDYRQFFRLFYQDRRSCAGHDLPERATRSVVLLFAHFVAREKWSDLDDLELPVVLRIEVNPAVSDQPPAAGPKLSGSFIKATVNF